MLSLRRRIGITAALLVAVLAAGTAHAAFLKGRGELRAAGNGLAVLELRGRVVVQGGGLAIVEERALVETDGVGRITELGDGRLLLEGFGRVVVRSPEERTRVEAAGAHLRLRARGAGVAFLKGCGFASTDDVDTGWDPDLELEFESGS